MFGAAIGDISGSKYEWSNIKSKDFQIMSQDCRFTDDTVMTCAVYAALKEYIGGGKKADPHKLLIERMQHFGREYPHAGYGGHFANWLISDDPKPYNSYGNGSAMRCSGAGFLAGSLEEAEDLARLSAEVSHNHREGIRGAVSTAESIYLARHGASMERLKQNMLLFYPLEMTLDQIRPTYGFEVSCQGSVPVAFEAFLESDGFEDCIRNAISVGGDSDTIAAIAGGIAEAFYGVPDELVKKCAAFLPEDLLEILKS